MTRLGHDFGTTAMGVGQVAARACTCDPEMRSHGIDTIDCPTHGLAVTMREAIRAQKERDRP